MLLAMPIALLRGPGGAALTGSDVPWTGVPQVIGPGIGRVPRTSRLPDGFTVELEASTRVHAGGAVLFGGQPLHPLRLHESVRADLVAGRVVVGCARTARLARRLLATGLGRPVPPPCPDGPVDIDIVIPVRDRDTALRRLLTAIRADPHTAQARVIVVDDGSVDQQSVRGIADTYGAEVTQLPSSRGPAAARNSGLAAARTALVAFLDSDCVPARGWLGPLIGHFSDPRVAIVAPRIVSVPRTPGNARGRRTGWLASYEHAASALDMGPEPGRAGPGLPLAYVPSAGMLARRTALGAGFAEGLMVAEDVDLVWRLVSGGWTVRYEPRAEVAHEHRTALGAFISRRAFYGTSGAMLGQRHGNAVAPIATDARLALTWAGVLIGRGWSVAGALVLQVGPVLRLARTLESYDIASPLATAADLVWRGWFSSGRYLLRRPGREYWPLSVAAAAVSPGLRRRLLAIVALDAALTWRGRMLGSRRAKAAAAATPLAPAARVEPAPSLLGFLAASRLDDLAYGIGVWRGAWQARSWTALRPRLIRRPPRRR